MLLVELTINNTMYRISNEELPLTHLWKQYIDNGFTAPSYRTRTDHGGFCELTFGSMPILPSLFEDIGVWPPQTQCRCNVYYTALLETNKTEMFSGYAHLKSYDRESITYDLYSDIATVPLLVETTDYNGDAVPIPVAFGAISHINPLRLADDGDGYPVYCLSGLSTDPAKYGTNIYNANIGTGWAPVGDAFIACVGHSFETNDDVTIEGFGDYDGTYTITDNAANVVDLNTSFTNIKYDLNITCNRTSGSGQFTYSIGDAPGIAAWANGGVGTFIYSQGRGYFKLSKDSSWAGTFSQLLLNLTNTPLIYIIGSASLKMPELWTVGAGWTVSATDGISAVAGTASDLVFSYQELEVYSGQLFKPGLTCFYDDGYPIPENIEAIDTAAFTLTASPVGELTISGVNPTVTTLEDVITWACHEDRLCMTPDITLGRGTSPNVNYWASSQGVLLDFLSEVCAWHTHLFYIAKDTAVSKTINLGSATYIWTVSASGTAEYYLTKADSSNPYKSRPDHVLLNSAEVTELTVGNLTAGTWAYGDNDSLGFETIYVRLADDTDPNTKADAYVQATYHDVLYLIDMAVLNGTRTLTEFDFFRADYEILPPVKSLSAEWTMREAVEETIGIYVKETNRSEKVLNYSYGSEDSFEPYDYTKSTVKATLQAILAYLNKPIVTISMPIYGVTLPVPGEKFTVPDTALVADTVSEIYVRSIQYDFDNDEFIISGEGIISEDI